MANVALWSGATGANNGTSWADAYTTLQAVITANGSSFTRIFVASDHSELIDTSVVFPGNPSLGYNLISCDRTSGFPPTVEQAGASIGSTSATSLTLQNSFYSKGVFLKAGDSSTASRNLGLDSTAANNIVRIVGGGVELKNTGTTSRIIFGSTAARNTKFYLENAEIRFGNASQGVQVNNGSVTIEDGALAGSAITEFIKSMAAPADVSVAGLDMTTGAAAMNLIASLSYPIGTIRFNKVKAPTSWSGSLMATPPTHGCLRATAINVDSASTNYKMQAVGYNGSMRQEATIVRTGGATDGATPISWRMATGSQYYPLTSFESLPIELWNETTGSALTVTAQVLTDGVTLKDDEAWIEIEYLDSTGSPLGGMATDEKANQLAAGADQATSSASWTTTGITTPITQQLSVTITPQKKGTIRAVVKLARSSTVMYLCPKIEIA